MADNFLTDTTYSNLTSYAPDISGHVNPASSFNLVGSQAGLSGITAASMATSLAAWPCRTTSP